MISYKQQAKIFKKLGIEKLSEKSKSKNNNYELASLLNESSSDENDNGSDCSDDEENTPNDDNFDASDLVIDLECEESTGKKLMMMEEEAKVSGEMQQFQERMNSRTA